MSEAAAIERLRGAFPVLERTAYLNAGTCGPLPRAGLEAAGRMVERAAFEGRSQGYIGTWVELREQLRSAYAGLLASPASQVALTTCTSEGVARVLNGLEIGRGDEVLAAPDEHPGLIGPLVTLREQSGATIRTAPFGDLADAVGPRTRVVVCSHVSWVTGAVRPEGLAELGPDVTVVLDGAQGVGAVPTDPAALGCAFYAGSGQKWLCGPVGTGMLWAAPEWQGRLASSGANYFNLADPDAGLDGSEHADMRRHDAPAISPEGVAWAIAAHDVLAACDWAAVHARAAALAGQLADRLRERGRTVAPRGDTTLVAWEDSAAAETRERLAAAGVVVRDVPGADLVRASVGAWSDEEDLDRLLAAL